MRKVIDTINRQARRTRISIAIICFILGFLLVTQLKGQLAAGKPLQNESEKNLAEITRNMDGEVSALKAESATLGLQLYKIRRLADDKKSILDEAKKSTEAIAISAGLVAVEGRGVTLTVADQRDRLNGIDLADILNELRAAGSEAISVNGKRTGTTTSFNRDGDGMSMDGKRINGPYTIEAIGDPNTIYQALTMAGGIRDTLTSSVPGVVFEIKSNALLSLPARDEARIEKAKPVGG